jgi:hypothetical protein
MRSIVLLLIAAVVPVTAAAQHPAAKLTGTMLDSLHNEPLAGARISVGVNRSATTDESGHFEIDSLVPGTYDVVATHPLIDSLGLTVAARGVVVSQSSRILLAVPGVVSITRMLCGETDATGGVITGRVIRAGSAEGIGAARVALTWLSLASDKASLGFISDAAETITDSRGYDAFCALPGDFEGSIQAAAGNDTTALVPVSLAWSPTGIVSRPLSLGGQPTSISGMIVDSAGRGISQADIDVPGTSRKATSRPDGSFTISGVRAGTRLMRARKLGYSSTIAPVEAGSNADGVRLTLGPSLPRLAPVIVRALRSEVADRTGFSRRALAGPGKYASGEQLVATKAHCVVEGLRHMLINLTAGPGCSVNLVSNHNWRGISSLQALLPALPPGEAAQKPRGSVSQSGCTSVYVDDVLEPFFDDRNGAYVSLAWLNPEEVVGIEYYSAAGAPGRYGQSHCNVMLIWTIAYRGAHH